MASDTFTPVDATGSVLLAAGIGAAAALLGQALGPLVGATWAHRHWLRDQRARTFETFFAALERAEYGTKANDRAVAELADELMNAASALKLYASEPIATLALECAIAFAIAHLGPAETRTDEEHEKFHVTAFVVRSEMRRELGIR